MKKRQRSTGNSSLWAGGIFFVAALVLWQLVCTLGLVPAFMLPSPLSVLRVIWQEGPVLLHHARITLTEAFLGLFLGVAGALLLSVLMDRSPLLRQGLYPVMLLTQTVPAVALAPLLVLWMGYGPAPKVTLVFLVCFFPVTVGLYDGFRQADPDALTLLRSMGAGPWQILWHLKLPGALPRFFSGLRIAVSYAVVGAVIAEWLGGDGGLGVYMTRVRKSYAFDKMFAVIFVVSVLSILLIRLTDWLEKKSIPWMEREQERE